MTINIIDEAIKTLLELFILGVFGGAVAWLFSRLQKNREIKLQVFKDFSRIHGSFIALRYEYNSFFIERRGPRSAEFHPLEDEEIRLEKWIYFQKSCELIGEIQAIKPLIVDMFPDTKEDMEFVFAKYQDWRRRTNGGKPILQQIDGKSEDAYKELRRRYSRIIKQMQKKI